MAVSQQSNIGDLAIILGSASLVISIVLAITFTIRYSRASQVDYALAPSTSKTLYIVSLGRAEPVIATYLTRLEKMGREVTNAEVSAMDAYFSAMCQRRLWGDDMPAAASEADTPSTTPPGNCCVGLMAGKTHFGRGGVKW